MIIVPPVMFYNKTYTEATCVLHLGTNVCGHDGIVHGGLAATILDEGLACVVSNIINLILEIESSNVGYYKNRLSPLYPTTLVSQPISMSTTESLFSLISGL